MTGSELPRAPRANADSGPGVPEALPRVVRLVGRRLGVAEIDRLWVFPPLKQGRRESGLVAVSCYEANESTRRLVTASYVAERTGKGLVVEPAIQEEGSAPPDTLPRVIAGVVKRAGLELGDPREVPVEGEAEAFETLMGEFDPVLLEEEEIQ